MVYIPTPLLLSIRAVRSYVSLFILVSLLASPPRVVPAHAYRADNACASVQTRSQALKEAETRDNQQDLRGALQCHERALKLSNNDQEKAESWLNMGIMYYAMQQAPEALRYFEKALELQPNNPDYHSAVGNAQNALGRFDDAIDSFDHALKLRPNSISFLYNKAMSFRTGRRIPEAIEAMEALLSRRDDPELRSMSPIALATALEGYGGNLRAVGQYDRAIKALEEAIELAPGRASFHNSLACVYILTSNYDQARTHLKQSIRLDPKPSDAYLNMANTYSLAKDYLPSLTWYEKAIKRDKFPYAAHIGSYLYAKQCVCHWKNYGKTFDSLRNALRQYRKRSKQGSTDVFKPEEMTFGALESLTMPFSGQETLEIATDTAANNYKKFPYLHNLPLPRITPLLPGKRLRIVYLSANFGYHVASSTIQGLFEQHDRDKFEVVIVALNTDDGSPLRKRFETTCDRFVDLSGEDVPTQSKKLKSMDIHILVDIDGYTSGTRREIFMSQIAPVQVLLMGYVGTIGDPASIQYNVGDVITTPPQHTAYYTEKLVMMPHSYFVNDHQSMYNARLPAIRSVNRVELRRQYGLPGDRIVFCNFNRHRKFDPKTFKIWMKILLAVPGSVLWMLSFDLGQERLWKEAERHGVERSRLIFSERTPLEQHLLVKSIADIFLDTPVYNSHTTGLDILYAGVPVVCLALDRMTSRVTASLINAIGTPDTIAYTWDEYIDIAIELASDPDKLTHIRNTIDQNRHSYPLFDLPRWARNFEKALQQLWEVTVTLGRKKRYHQFIHDPAPMGQGSKSVPSGEDRADDKWSFW